MQVFERNTANRASLNYGSLSKMRTGPLEASALGGNTPTPYGKVIYTGDKIFDRNNKIK